MTFIEVLEQVRGLLQSQGRISYRALKRQFDLDDEYLADLKEELLFAHPQVADEDGRGLVWRGGERSGEAEKGSTAVASPQFLIPNPQSEAEACFHKAIEVARRQSAKSLELRAVMSLARLWQQQGKRQDAHEMLAEIYHWFTEGFDTKDLQEARALLEELSEERINQGNSYAGSIDKSKT